MAVLLIAPTAASQQGVLEEGFDDPALPGWEVGPGVVATDGVLVVPVGGFAFYGPPVADVAIITRLRRDPGAIAAIHLNATDDGVYTVRLGTDFTAIVRDEGGQVDEIAVTDEGSPPGDWFETTVLFSGGFIEVIVDGTPVLTVDDPAPLPPGAVGFHTEGEGIVEYDFVVVGPAEGGAPSAEPAPVPPPGQTELSWVRTGGPIGGLGYDIRMHPADPDHLYVTDSFAGVFISDDGGDNWYPSNEGITTRSGTSGDSIPVFSVTLDPSNPDIVWAGTQNTRGIFKSTDGGLTWIPKINGIVEAEGISFRGFGVDPNDSDTVYAAAEIASWIWAGQQMQGREFDRVQGVVYKTTNGGDSWSAVWRGDNLARYVLIDPRDSDILYVSTGIFDREAADSDPQARAPGGEGVVKSTDGGRTWSNVTVGLDNTYVGSLSMHPDDPDILLAGAANNQYYHYPGVYRTTDGGATWTRTLDAGIQSVEIVPSDPNVAYAMGVDSVHRSTDTGLTWTLMAGGNWEEDGVTGWGPPGVRAGFPIDIEVDPRDPNRLFVNNYGGGNFLSEDGGTTWTVASRGYTGAQVRDVAVAGDAPGRVYVAARSGLFGSFDGGGDWAGILDDDVYFLEWNAIAVDPTDPDHLVAGSNWGGSLSESFDGGRSWDIVHSIGENFGWRAIAFAPTDSSRVYVGTGSFISAGGFANELPGAGVRVSDDGGTTWRSTDDGAMASAHVIELAVHPGDADTVYAATARDGLLRSDDGGATWTEVATGIDRSIALFAVAIAPSDPDLILVGSALRGMVRSTDGGASWNEVVAGIAAESAVSDIAFDPLDPSVVYAADLLSGVYRSSDGGESWEPINTGLRTRSVTSLDMSADGLHLYAGTDGEGVFRLDLAGTPPATASPLGGGEDPGEVTTGTSPPTDSPEATVAPGSAAPETGEEDGGTNPLVFVGIGGLALIVLGAGWAVARRRQS